MRRGVIALAVLAAIAAGAGWWLTAPEVLDAAALDGLTGDAAAGETVFWAAGCASCHAGEDAEGEARLVLSGGQSFATPFGTFLAPNISPDPDNGIGGWSDLDFVNAMVNGVSPQGQHYYPAFPYAAYRLAELQDLVDLRAYLATLPASATPSQPHDLGFPFSIRRSVGLWKFLFLGDDFTVAGDLPDEAARGRYLVEALGHCGECHTERNALGGLDRGRWLGGAPNPVGTGRIPNITPGGLRWSQSEIANYLSDGFTPDFDVVGGEMTSVVRNLAHLDQADRLAIAAYLQSVAAVE